MAQIVLPIRKRGLFSQDAFFNDVQGDFNSAIENVMDRWSGRSLLADQFSSSRQLEKEQPKDDSLIASISDSKETYTIVLDLSSFVSGEITVRTLGFNAVVEAKTGSKHLSKKFPLPSNSNVEGVVAAMSDDGIMTISVPKTDTKKKLTATSTSSVDNTSNSSPKERKDSFMSSLKFDFGDPDKNKMFLMNQSDRKTSTGGRVIPLVMEGDESSLVASQIESNQSSTTAAAASLSAAQSTVQSESSSISSSTATQDRVLPIMKRGQFFKDSFFQNVWGDFESSVKNSSISESLKNCSLKNIIESSEEQKSSNNTLSAESNSKKFNRLNSYRNLRDWALNEDNQAATITKEATCYKVVLDVHKFVDGELDVKAEAGTVVIIGDKDGFGFKKTFTLPGMEKPDEVVADLSKDGILTVTAPL